MLTQGFQKFYESITEATEAPETIFQQRGGACRPVASSLSNPTSKMFWKGLDSNCYLHHMLLDALRKTIIDAIRGCRFLLYLFYR